MLVVVQSHATYSLLPKAWLPISADAAKPAVKDECGEVPRDAPFAYLFVLDPHDAKVLLGEGHRNCPIIYQLLAVC